MDTRGYLQFVAHQVGHLVKAVFANVAFVRALVCVRENMVAQVT